MAQHIGIVGCSSPHAQPEVTLHTPSLAALMLASAHKLAGAGDDFLICPDKLALLRAVGQGSTMEKAGHLCSV